MVKRLVLLLIVLNVLLMYYLFSPGSQPEIVIDDSEVKLKKDPKELEADYRRAMPDGACYSIGPFKKTFEADRVMGDLVGLGIPNERRTTQDADNFQTNYVVFLPPQKNRMEAIKVGRKLKSQGFRESYVISTGVNKDAIFLGIYNNKDKAMSKLGAIKEMGYQAKLQPRKSARSLYWLDIRRVDGVKKDMQNQLESIIQGLDAKVIPGNC